jgi:hypothetical protein
MSAATTQMRGSGRMETSAIKAAFWQHCLHTDLNPSLACMCDSFLEAARQTRATGVLCRAARHEVELGVETQ